MISSHLILAQLVDCIHNRKHYKRSNHYLNHRSYLSNSKRDKLRSIGCTNKLDLDQTYYVYYYNHLPNQTVPLIIFASVYRFPKPVWAMNHNEDQLDLTWKPRKLPDSKATYSYVKLTNWYSYHLLTLRILDYFDYNCYG